MGTIGSEDTDDDEGKTLPKIEEQYYNAPYYDSQDEGVTTALLPRMSGANPIVDTLARDDEGMEAFDLRRDGSTVAFGISAHDQMIYV